MPPPFVEFFITNNVAIDMMTSQRNVSDYLHQLIKVL